MDSDKKGLLSKAAGLPAIPFNNPTGTIVIDTETTGLDPENDEILQISILDGNGSTLLNTLVQPYWHTEWKGASRINHIYPDLVKNMPLPADVIPKVKGIFDSAELIIGYNLKYDLSFLAGWGIQTDNKECFDVMSAFAEEYGDWNDFYGNYTWQKLTTAAEYYGYRYQAHGSLEDARATLFVYNRLTSH